MNKWGEEMSNEYLWLAVTPDELELPIVVVDTATELAHKFGMKPNDISSAWCKKLSGKNWGFKVIKVEVNSKNGM